MSVCCSQGQGHTDFIIFDFIIFVMVISRCRQFDCERFFLLGDFFENDAENGSENHWQF